MRANRLIVGLAATLLLGNMAVSGWLFVKVRRLERGGEPAAKVTESVFPKPANPWVSIAPDPAAPSSATNLDDMKLTSMMHVSWKVLSQLAEDGKELSVKTRKRLLELQTVIERIGDDAGIAEDKRNQLYLILNTYAVRSAVARRRNAPDLKQELAMFKDQTRIQTVGFYGEDVARIVLKSLDALVVP